MPKKNYHFCIHDTNIESERIKFYCFYSADFRFLKKNLEKLEVFLDVNVLLFTLFS